MQPENPGQDLIPLALAVRIVYLQMRGKGPAAHVLERLNAVAYSLAAAGAMYAIEGPYRLARRLSREELAAAVFRRGATEIHFLDERPVLTKIAVTRESVEKTIKVIAIIRQASERCGIYYSAAKRVAARRLQTRMPGRFPPSSLRRGHS
jgi:hypothetical protein